MTKQNHVCHRSLGHEKERAEDITICDRQARSAFVIVGSFISLLSTFFDFSFPSVFVFLCLSSFHLILLSDV